MPWATRHATVTGQTHSNTKRQRLFATEGTENDNGGDFVTATATATAFCHRGHRERQRRRFCNSNGNDLRLTAYGEITENDKK